MLSNLNGIQMAKRTYQRFVTPIFMFSAFKDDDSILDGYQTGADQYIAKSLNVFELLTCICL